jgi:hypothetical protein
MTVPQVTIRLQPQRKRAFDNYAGELGLHASELAKLLIVREKSIRQLATLHAAGKLPERDRRKRGSGIQPGTVTAHLSDVDEVKKFDKYARSCHLSRNAAGALLLEQELLEKWLKRALKLPWRRQNEIWRKRTPK